MSPTPTPTPAPLPDDLRGMTPEIMARVDAALDHAASADGNLDALLGHTVIVWKERRVGGVGNAIRLRRQTNAEKKTETARAKLTREGFTFTPADADDVPPAPVNLDSDGDR